VGRKEAPAASTKGILLPGETRSLSDWEAQSHFLARPWQAARAWARPRH